MRPNWNPRRLPIRNIRRSVKFQNKNQSYAPIVRTSLNGASLQQLHCFDSISFMVGDGVMHTNLKPAKHHWTLKK